ncbi:MAG: hypothetical protein QM627_12260 [Luteolibacter sp.]
MKHKSHSTSRRSILDRKYPCCKIYAVELSPEAYKHPGFLSANPFYQTGQPCIYVGMTSLTPEQRLDVHRSGIGSPIVIRHGVRLRPDLIPRFSPKPRYQAMKLEREIARKLRANGFGVWQH